jgi:type IV pilus assembly protein PilY1
MSTIFSRTLGIALAALLGVAALPPPAGAQTVVTLADQPIFSAGVPASLALVLSVEFPTAISVANTGDYADASTYAGYFDPAKCYNYSYNTATPSSSYFVPAAFGTGTSGHQCSGMWSGNFMNWATMQTIDPFRWALTGGYRSEDDSTTVLEKAWGSLQGSTSNSLFPFNSAEFPYRGTSQILGSGNYLLNTSISTVTPFSNWGSFNSAIWGNGNTMIFSGGTALAPATGYYSAYGYGTTLSMAGTANSSVYDLTNNLTTVNILAQPATYRVYVRVQVCNSGTVGGKSLLESNCVRYGSNYKPEGLLQKYSNRFRVAALSYLNGDGISQQGGVLRAPMGFIGPTSPVPLSTSTVVNPLAEWSSTDGHQFTNPDTATASASGVSQSGVIQYLNQFGEYTAKTTNAGNYTNNTNTYMKDDNVSELYYAAIRYFENLGNVSAWSTPQTTTSAIELDGFPAVTTWSDPVAYSCQNNFILGIGDDHTHYDYNVANNGGATDPNITRAAPAFSDSVNQSYTWTSAVETLEGISSSPPWYNYSGGGGSYATYFIAGLAYGAHVTNIRPDIYASTGNTQTISTYWMDVAEYGLPEYQNQYYMATKYGGFAVPSNYSITNTTPLAQSTYDPSLNTFTTHVSGSYTTGVLKTSPQPANYFVANNANAMVSGLNTAFASIAIASSSNSSAYTLSSPNQTSAGGLSFSSVYDPNNWTDVITASTLSFDSNGNPISSTPAWVSSTTLQTQLAGTGWQIARKVVTWNGTAGVPFEVANLSATQLAALVPSSYASNTSTQYLSYLRGDQSNEVGSTATGGTQSLRARSLLLGDIVDANLTPVSGPSMGFSDGNNPGYAAFTTLWAARPTVVYAAANDGMLHGFLGATGSEIFAYVPSATIQGPTGTPQVNGLAALGNPNFTHHYYVDATPLAFDVDLNHTGGNTSGSPNWHTLLIGGLGKGGKSYYAIDITDPATMALSTESVLAAKVQWEFTDSTMGYSYGAPIVVKTAQYGWVAIFTSGYNSSSTLGYIYIVNPSTGALLQKIATPSASSGLTQASAFIQDATDFTAESVYVGDLNGQVWRFDLTKTSGTYPAPTLLATLTDSSGNAQPVTSAPEIEIHPSTLKRYVMLGTGKLLSSSDVASTAIQSFYVILDGVAGAFSTVSTPITRTSMQAVTASGLVAGITLTPTQLGWYIDLGTGTGGIAWRVILSPVSFDGTVAFAADLPSGNACNPGGQSEIYAVNYATATSILISQPAGYALFTSATVDLNYVGVNGSVELLVGLAGNGGNGTSGGGTSTSSGISCTANNTACSLKITSPSAVSTRILNWRELPSAQ